jgi:hypothetical protein
LKALVGAAKTWGRSAGELRFFWHATAG